MNKTIGKIFLLWFFIVITGLILAAMESSAAGFFFILEWIFALVCTVVSVRYFIKKLQRKK